ncbi:hypothetical protein BT93_L5802 [Corymbia citriodora subsp. variegata]|uniref:GTP-binding protein n=1 Tax=Corymbia citriodora subsp. variegata TaxID=360336 RepID=A0A8T0CEZ5_CORYI|nr:hypothetical protein BT93_L5802 [Corymbia citriodora subsp. variegata]
MDNHKRKKKVLLMGKSGSGKSSMRAIIFSNYVAKDVRRLGATIDVEHSHARFMGSLTLNLWDCGGQDAFMDSYLSTQRSSVFTDVSALIYVFDIESRDPTTDLETYNNIIRALKSQSPTALIFCLIHKMDLVQNEHRERIYDERCAAIVKKSEGMDLETFASSIWDQTLYKAWAGIVHRMIPNLVVIERFLLAFAKQIYAEEIVLFERSTFLTVTHVSVIRDSNESSETQTGDVRPEYTTLPAPDRHERISSIMKSYKHTCTRHSRTSASAAGAFVLFKAQTPSFNSFLARFTENTYICVVIPPGEAAFNCAVLNTMIAKDAFLTRTGVET